MSEKKIAVGYVFNFDCNNDVLRLKMKEEIIGGKCDGEVIELNNEPALARVSRVTKPHPESLTTWYDLEFPAVVYNSFTKRVTETEIYKMGGELDILASAAAIANEILEASSKGDHEGALAIWSRHSSQADDACVKILIEVHKSKGVFDALVKAAQQLDGRYRS